MQFSETFNEPSENHFMETSSLKEDSLIFENFFIQLIEEALSFQKSSGSLMDRSYSLKYSFKSIDGFEILFSIKLIFSSDAIYQF